MNLQSLARANELRHAAIIADNDPLLHAAADVEVSRAVHAHEDALLLKRAQARLARMQVRP